MQSGTRPVIIMQNDVGNYFSPTVTIVPLTSKDKKPGQPTHYRLDMKKYPFLTSSSTALCESPRTLDKRLLKKYLGRIDKADLAKVDEALAAHIGYRIPEAVDKAELTELSSVRVLTDSQKQPDLEALKRQTKNLYRYRVGNVVVEFDYLHNGRTVNDLFALMVQAGM